MVEAVGRELLLLEHEIVKLCCYVGERDEITARDVSVVTASSPDDVMFVTVDAIVRRQTDRALGLLADLHRYDPKPQAVAGKLLALLARQYRMVWQAKYLAGQGLQPRDVRALPPDVAAELPADGNIVQVAFKAGDVFAQARGYSWAELERTTSLLLQCDLANKGAVTDEAGVFGVEPVGNLQLLVMELTAARGAARETHGGARA
jgi:DNA polymerase-3 subunit delta